MARILIFELCLISSTITFVKTELIYGNISDAIPFGNISIIFSKSL